MKRNSEYKDKAVQRLEGNWGMAAIITLVYSLIFQAPSLPNWFNESEVLSLSSSYDILVLLLLPLAFGYTIIFLNLMRGQKIEFATLFDGFKDYGRMLGTLLLMYLYQFLWALLLIIPGIIKNYSYSQTLYLMKDDSSLSYNAAIEKSMEMMNGYKMKLFLLDLSLIGWAILSVLTLGIGFLFLSPYYQASHAAFYEDLKREKFGSIEIISE